MQAFKRAREVIVPKDTNVIGHVTEAQLRTKEQKVTSRHRI